MPNILELESKKLKIKIENFEGPLDLLCHLIDKNKMDIYDINLSAITEQYIDYINKMEEEKLLVSSEFLVMASTLLLIKSKKLLPNAEGNEEEEITEEELIRRIVEYKKYKEISKKLKEMYEEYSNRVFRMAEQITLPKQTLDRVFDKEIIPTLYQEAYERYSVRENVNKDNIEKIAIRDTYTVASKVKEIFRELIRKPKFIFNKIYTVSKCNEAEVVTAFTGLLELSRRNKIKTEQNETFGDIVVEKKKKISA